MKTIKLICFVIALFGLTFNSSVWARGGHHYGHHHGHHRNHIGGFVLGLALGSALRYGLGYGGYSGYNGYGTRYYLPHNAYRPVVTVPVVPSVYFQR
jgi:hypothetical protein